MKPHQMEIDEGLRGVAQAVINISEGHTTIEAGSQLANAFDLLLKPANANAINALSDLIDALRVALPAVAMSTGDGARRWPSNTPRTASGEPDFEQIAALIRKALAKVGGAA